MAQTAVLQTGNRAGIFDNIRIAAIPEPSTALLVSVFAIASYLSLLRRRVQAEVALRK